MNFSTRPQRDAIMNNPWALLWNRWAPALLSTPVMLAAYVVLAMATPGLLAARAGFWVGLSIASFLAGLLIGTFSRLLGVYAVRGAAQEGVPQRQGITAAQLALIATWFIYPRMGVEHGFWTYLVAFLVLGVVAAATITLVARWQTVQSGATALRPAVRANTTTGPTRPNKVAPRWAQRVAAVCLALGVVSLVRLLTDGTPHFLWGGLALLVIGALLPTLVVALGGGRHPEA